MTRLAKPREQTLYPDLEPREWGQPRHRGGRGTGRERCTLEAGLQCPVPSGSHLATHSALISYSEKWEK